MANRREMPNDMLIVVGKNFTKSANGPTIVKRKGKKMAHMEIVATTNEGKKVLALCIAAFHGLSPRRRLSIYPSIITMLSSTIMPKVTINAAKVTVFIS